MKVAQRRQLIGRSQDMYAFASELLDIPTGKRFKAKAAVDTRFATNKEKKAGLCKDLMSDLYKDELVELAKELGIHVSKGTSKKELCEMISIYAQQADMPMPSEIPEELAETRLQIEQAEHRRQMSNNLRRIYQTAYNKYGSELLNKSIKELGDEFGMEAFPIDLAKLLHFLYLGEYRQDIPINIMQVNEFNKWFTPEKDINTFRLNNLTYVDLDLDKYLDDDQWNALFTLVNFLVNPNKKFIIRKVPNKEVWSVTI